jgi:hypothetical protein
VLRPTVAWILLLAVYASCVAGSVCNSAVVMLGSLHLISRATMHHDLTPTVQTPIWVGATLFGLIALVALSVPLTGPILRGRKNIARLTARESQLSVAAGYGLCLLTAVTLVAHPRWFADSDLLWRTTGMLLVVALAFVIAVRYGITRADLGLSAARRRGKIVIAAVVFVMSACGMIATEAVGSLLGTLVPTYTADFVTQGGQGEAYSIAASLSDAVAEELVCTALVCVLLSRAGRPRWQICAAAGVLRVAFHLYLGSFGLGTAVFAILNAQLFLTNRRLLPLIVAHTLFDVIMSLSIAPRLMLPLCIGALVVFCATGWRKNTPQAA